MLKDIDDKQATGISICIVREINEENAYEWNVYLYNQRGEDIANVLVVCSGYAMADGEKIETSVTRYFLGDVASENIAKVEPIQEELFTINNRYHISFYQGEEIFEKKIVIPANTISEDLLHELPIKKPGMMFS